MRTIFTEAETKRIADCVAAVERASATEIVPLVVEASDDYPAAGWRAGASAAFLAALLLAYFFPHLDPLWFLAGALGAFLVGLALAQWPPCLRFALRDYKVDEEVHQRAVQAFHELGVHRTRERTGILIFVSLLEHRAEIICDVGIAAKVPREAWKEIVDTLARDVKRGELSAGLCRAVESAGKLTSRHFPGASGDANELSDAVVLRKE